MASSRPVRVLAAETSTPQQISRQHIHQYVAQPGVGGPRDGVRTFSAGVNLVPRGGMSIAGVNLASTGSMSIARVAAGISELGSATGVGSSCNWAA